MSPNTQHPLHILLIHQIYMSPGEAGGTRHHELGRHLIERGHRVTIIASSVSYLTGKKMQVGNREKGSGVRDPKPESRIPNPEVIRTWAYSGVQRSFVGRLLSFFSFMVSSFAAAMKVTGDMTRTASVRDRVPGQRQNQPVDLVWGTSPPIFQAFTAWLVARLKRVPFVFEVRDLWPDFAIQTGVLRNPLFVWASRRLERFLYSHADHLIVNSPGFIPHLQSCGVAGGAIHLVPNGVEPGMFHPEDRGEAVRREFGIAGRFVALYTGALGLANDLDTIIHAAKRLADQPRIAFVLLGDGKEKTRLSALVQTLGLKNLRFIPAQPKSRMPEFLAAADVCIATLKAIPMFGTTYPNKVFDYMAAGRPTVLGIDGVIRQVIEQAQGGTFVPPGNADALAETILSYYHSPCLRSFQGSSARRYVEKHFDRAQHAAKLEQILLAVRSGELGARNVRNSALRTPHSPLRSALKRALDLSLTIPALLFLSPLMVALWLLVRLMLGQPVIFRQTRAGRHGRPFVAFKFRTMTDAADNHGRLLPDADRITRLGRFLRNASLDELPGLFNVLTGDMSLVGPRPLLMEYLSRYSPEQARRHELKPGITGWAQINGRNAINWEEKLALDVWYVDHRSIGLDLHIIIRTAWKVVTRAGIAFPGHATAPVFQGTATSIKHQVPESGLLAGCGLKLEVPPQ
jgi:lipopolysaccharide/colanic/teichoic acid biosynthesis glycosyltransferase/glycosyltransferase involved in cell wall biosynthesis